MTAEEKEIRDWERKLMARIRRVKIKESKKLAAMTSEERQEYWRKGAEELKARGYNFG
jgi:hypothetical protein